MEFRSDAWIHRCVKCGLVSHDGEADAMSYWTDGSEGVSCYCGACAKRQFDWPPEPAAEPAEMTA